jgi:hypothetical protein
MGRNRRSMFASPFLLGLALRIAGSTEKSAKIVLDATILSFFSDVVTMTRYFIFIF